jgi:hypothetical protein
MGRGIVKKEKQKVLWRTNLLLSLDTARIGSGIKYLRGRNTHRHTERMEIA